jgi:hypothetical protein
LVQLKENATPDVLLESGQVKLGPIGAHRNFDKHEIAAVIGLRFPTNGGGFIDQSDLYTGQDCATGVGHAAEDSAARALGQEEGGIRKTKQDD